VAQPCKICPIALPSNSCDKKAPSKSGTKHLVRRHAETSEPIPCPSLRAKRSNPRAAVRPSGLLALRMLWPLDCFVARAPRNDGWVAADPIDSVVIGRRLSGTSHKSKSPRSRCLLCKAWTTTWLGRTSAIHALPSFRRGSRGGKGSRQTKKFKSRIARGTSGGDAEFNRNRPTIIGTQRICTVLVCFWDR
jgi:hypothetical protein